MVSASASNITTWLLHSDLKHSTWCRVLACLSMARTDRLSVCSSHKCPLSKSSPPSDLTNAHPGLTCIKVGRRGLNDAQSHGQGLGGCRCANEDVDVYGQVMDDVQWRVLLLAVVVCCYVLVKRIATGRRSAGGPRSLVCLTR